jgi:hypothetical protein
VALLLLRLSVFVVMLMWTLDKFVRPAHAAAISKAFYRLPLSAPGLVYLLGALELVLLVGFVVGVQKRLTYGAVTVLHGLSTVAAFNQYLAPFQGTNLLFYAAWPMLAACVTLYSLRDLDSLGVVGQRPRRQQKAEMMQEEG